MTTECSRMDNIFCDIYNCIQECIYTVQLIRHKTYIDCTEINDLNKMSYRYNQSILSYLYEG
jgi:hypothetical protein